jgi:hypothetical protein
LPYLAAVVVRLAVALDQLLNRRSHSAFLSLGAHPRAGARGSATACLAWLTRERGLAGRPPPAWRLPDPRLVPAWRPSTPRSLIRFRWIIGPESSSSLDSPHPPAPSVLAIVPTA